MGNLDELYRKFCTKYPEIKISLTKFREMRPPYCILAGGKGSHNVCVCKIHQNLRLRYAGIKQTLLKKHIQFDKSYRDSFNEMVCKESKSNCFLLNCQKCPGAKNVIKKITEILEHGEITEIKYTQWLTVDR